MENIILIPLHEFKEICNGKYLIKVNSHCQSIPYLNKKSKLTTNIIIV